MAECIFCNYAENEEGKYLLATNKHAAAFCYDELREGQCMVVPKAHLTSISQLSTEEFAAVTELIGSISQALEKKYNSPKTYLLCISDMVEHIHFHLIPKHEDKISLGNYCFRKLMEAEGVRHTPQNELDALIKELREIMGAAGKAVQ